MGHTGLPPTCPLPILQKGEVCLPVGQRLVADTGDEHILEPVQRELVHDIYLGQVSKDKVQGCTPCSYLLMVKIKIMRVLKVMRVLKSIRLDFLHVRGE